MTVMRTYKLQVQCFQLTGAETLTNNYSFSETTTELPDRQYFHK